MTRKEFTREIAERVLIRCRRHCCVCGKFCGTKIVIHHIDGNEDNSEENALPVCFDCHAEINNYTEEHPLGRKYQPSELKRLREITFRKFAAEPEVLIPGVSLTEYGKGFHDGANLIEKRVISQLVWNFIARHGDFGIEILLMFGDDDWCPMTDETFYDDQVITGTMASQHDGHEHAWDVGLNLGFWFVDGDKEQLVLSKRGRFFREAVLGNADLRSRYDNLATFWKDTMWGTRREKPGARPADMRYTPGWSGWLEIEKYRPVKILGQLELFVLTSVEPDEVEVQSVESQTKLTFSPQNLKELEYEEESGLMCLSVDDGAIRTSQER